MILMILMMREIEETPEEYWERIKSRTIPFEDRMSLFRIFFPAFHDDTMYQNFSFDQNQENFEKLFDEIGIPKKINHKMNLVGGSSYVPNLHKKVSKFVYDCYDEVYDFKNNQSPEEFLSTTGTTS